MNCGKHTLESTKLCKLITFFLPLLFINDKIVLINIFEIFRQKDIGLVKYETRILFFHLFYPTLLVIITVVQLQMFHKKYLEKLEFPISETRDGSDSGIQPSSSVNYGSLEQDTPSDDLQRTKSRYTRINVSDLKNLTTKQVCISLWFQSNTFNWIFWILPFLFFYF